MEVDEGTGRNKILVIGPSSTEKGFLIRDIVGSTVSPTKYHDFKGLELDCFPWTIDTKYYSAKVEFLIFDVESSKPISNDLMTHFGEISEALIFMVTTNESQSLHILNQFTELIEEHMPSVLMCAGDEEKSTISQWCVDNGVEFVPMKDISENEKEGPFQEVFGKDRIVEALHATMWPNMDYKSESRPTRVQLEFDEEFGDFVRSKDVMKGLLENEKKVSENIENGHEIEEEKEKKNENDNVMKSEEKEEEIDNEDELEGENREKKESENEQIKTGENKKKRRKKKKNRNKKSKSVTTEKLLFKDDEIPLNVDDLDEEMKELEFFEKAIGNLSQMRQKATKMPDKERRELAAQFAMSFLQSFGDD
eukprot:TRINITY_DN1131_c0_g1_i2.p1 TRINITY_DN1131_c0_g1~~TRINITY_DN1131_c0_g1_i2.p1  ORF type:complete len:365 (+),score=123.75 TRINITY_DN1131_c0_g1_i2:56-1150(+)